jgi:arylsulfatase A-like enzyme
MELERRRYEAQVAGIEMAFQRTVKDYYRLATGIDREVGRILAALDERGLAGNTVVIFTSDNGFFLGERGLADKWLPYEESIRVPLVVYDPRLAPVAQASPPASSRTVPVRAPESRGNRPAESGRGTLPELAAGTAALPAARAGAVVDAMTLNIDLAPTLLDLARVRAPKSMQGRSLAPFLEGKSPRGWRKEFFYEHHTRKAIIPPSEGVRTVKWKYFRYVESQPVVEELYDLANDPGEERNLATDPKHANTLAELRARWSKLSRQLK